MGFSVYWRTCPARNVRRSNGLLAPRSERRRAAREMWKIVGRREHAKRVAASRASCKYPGKPV